VGEVQAYLRANAASLVDYARRYLRGQRISTAVVESMVNRVIGRRMAKKQPMRWSRLGAHLLVQIRVAVLDGRLEQVFRHWYARCRPLAPPAAPAP
jgi:capsid protein